MTGFYRISIFFLILTLVFSACSSPTDVPANRRITKEGGTEEVSPLAITIPGDNFTNELIFYDVSLDVGYQSKDFILYNTSDKPVTIDTIAFANPNSKFSIWTTEFPIELAPKDEEGFSKRLYLNFNADRIGEFRDTLRFDKFSEPLLFLRAIVPTVEVTSINYGTVRIGATLSKAITLRNHGENTILVQSAHVIDQEGVFNFLSTLPVEIPPGSSVIRIVEFAPKEAKTYSARIEFDIEAEGFVNTVAELTGKGIRP